MHFLYNFFSEFKFNRYDKFFIVDTNATPRESITEDLEANILRYEEEAANLKSYMNYMVDVDYVVDLVKNFELFSNQYALVDIRSYGEYIGEITGYEELKTKVRLYI